MASDYLRPMLDVGSPRVFNCNVMTRRILASDANAATFFRCKPLNNLILIKDSDPHDPRGGAIGTKLYFPFNENDIYEGGRTIFVHDKGLEGALLSAFGEGALPRDALNEDMRIMRTLDGLPSLDPFLLKDVFVGQRIAINPAYFEVDAPLRREIEQFFLERFRPLAQAAFPSAVGSDDMARKLVEKIWEGSDMEALKPLIVAFRFPAGQERDIFAAWKGIIYYGFQQSKAAPDMAAMATALKDMKIPMGSGTTEERAELKEMLDSARTRLQSEWQAAGRVLQDYQTSYDDMFTRGTSSNGFLAFLRDSRTAYWTLGNSLGKTAHALYCWDNLSKRYPGRKLPWEQTIELLQMLEKILRADKKAASAKAW